MDKELGIVKVIKYVAIGLLALIIFWGSWGTVNAGDRGVRLRMSAVVGTVDSGLYFKLPLIESVKKFEVRTVKKEVAAVAYSKDIQTVESTIALNYHLDPASVGTLYRELGSDYESRIIDPAIQESVKAAFAQFTAQELVEQRPKVKDTVLVQLAERLDGRYITVDDFSIVNFDFSNVYEAAIEQKQKAQQDALRAENELKKVQFEAEQRVTQAKAEAEAIRIQAAAIQNQGGAEYVNLKAIEKWNGTLPQYMLGQTTPFINLNK